MKKISLTLSAISLVLGAASQAGAKQKGVQNPVETKTWCSVYKRLADEDRSYESGWKKTKAEALAVALESCEADVVVYPASCEMGRCVTRPVKK